MMTRWEARRERLFYIALVAWNLLLLTILGWSIVMLVSNG